MPSLMSYTGTASLFSYSFIVITICVIGCTFHVYIYWTAFSNLHVSAILAGRSGESEKVAQGREWIGEGGCGSTSKRATYDNVADGEVCACKYMLIHTFE
jgi:hypothetical protein